MYGPCASGKQLLRPCLSKPRQRELCHQLIDPSSSTRYIAFRHASTTLASSSRPGSRALCSPPTFTSSHDTSRITSVNRSRSLATHSSDPLTSSLHQVPSPTNPATYSSSLLTDQLQSTKRHFDSCAGDNASVWSRRVARAIADLSEGTSAQRPLRILVAGRGSSRTADLIRALLDEPLKEQGHNLPTDSEVLSDFLSSQRSSSQLQPISIRYAPGPAKVSNGDTITIDREWLARANAQIKVIFDPPLSEQVNDLAYESDLLLLTTDTHALEQFFHTSKANTHPCSEIFDLARTFSDKPGTQLLINRTSDVDAENIHAALERALGLAASERFISSDSVVMFSSRDALVAHQAFRTALSQEGPHSGSSAWDEFGAKFRSSNVVTIQRLLLHRAQEARDAQVDLKAALHLLSHSVSEANALLHTSKASLDEMHLLISNLRAENDQIASDSIERIWPTSEIYASKRKSPRLSNTGSSGVVNDALVQTKQAVESTFARKLQWWKLIWKVDDIRAELEAVCSGFAHSLETKLAFESGRLSGIQREQNQTAGNVVAESAALVQQLAPLKDAPREMALFTMDAEANRSNKQTAIVPDSLAAPIRTRRQQLLQIGGPIDSLARKAQRLTVLTSTALVTTAAGISSASILGSSLSDTALAIEPSSAFALALLVYTAAAWRMQGRFAKIKSDFWQDWHRLADNLDQDLKSEFEDLLHRQITSQAKFVAGGLESLETEWRAKLNEMERKIPCVLRNGSQWQHLKPAEDKASLHTPSS